MRPLLHSNENVVAALLFNSAVSVVLMSCADATAQKVEIHYSKKRNSRVALLKAPESEKSMMGRSFDAPPTYDVDRTVRMGMLGIFSAHYLHAWYHVLDLTLPGHSFGTVVLKAVVDNTFAIPYYCLLLGANALLAEGTTSRVCELVRKEVGTITIISTLLWVPEDILMFTFVPSSYWILCDKLVDLIYLPGMAYLANRSLRKPTGEPESDDECSGDGSDPTPKDRGCYCTVL